jgi:hypothetical protein
MNEHKFTVQFTRQSFYVYVEMIRGVQGGKATNAQGQIREPFLDEGCGDV